MTYSTDLRDRLPESLDRIAATTPVPDADVFDPDKMTLVDSETPRRRYGVAAAAAVAILGVGGLIVIAQRDVDGDFNAPAATPADAVTSAIGTTPSTPEPPAALVLPPNSGLDLTQAVRDRDASLEHQGVPPEPAVMRWYVDEASRDKEWIRVTLGQDDVPGGPSGCMLVEDVTEVVSYDNGPDGCRVSAEASATGLTRVQRFVDGASVIVTGTAADAQLAAASAALVRDPTVGFGLAPEALPAGFAEAGVGQGLSDFAIRELDDDPVLSQYYEGPNGKSLFLVAVQEDESFFRMQRMDEGTMTDITVAGEPALLRTSPGDPVYRGVVFRRDGRTYTVGSRGLTDTELIDLVERLEPVSATAWSAIVDAHQPLAAPATAAVTTVPTADSSG